MSEDINREARRLAWIGTIQTVFISIGASIMAVGFTTWITIWPILVEMIERNDKETIPNNQIKLVEFLNNNTLFFIVAGLMLIILGVLIARTAIYRKTKQS